MRQKKQIITKSENSDNQFSKKKIFQIVTKIIKRWLVQSNKETVLLTEYMLFK